MKKILFIICFVVCLLGSVSAAEYTPSVTFQVSQTEVIDNYTAFCVGTNHSGLVNLCYDLLDTYEYISVTYGPVYSGSFAAYLLTFYNDDYLGVGANDTTFITSGSSFNYAVVCFNNSSYCAISCSSTGTLLNGIYRHYTYNVTRTFIRDSWLGSSEYNNIKQKAVNYKFNGWVSSNFYQYPFTSMNTGISGYGSFLSINHYNDAYNIINIYNPIFNSIRYTDDPNLKLNIINNEYGEKELAIDFTAFMGGSPANYISVENLILTVDNDGTEIVFDDLDSYIEHFGTGTDQEVWAYIPLSVLVGSAAESKLVKVSFTESTSSAGGTYTEDHYISTNLWLKHEEYIIPNTITPPATIYNDVKTTTQINNIINELNQKGSEYDITTGKFSYYQTVPDYPDWADMYEFNVIFSRSGSDASLFDTWHRMNGSNYSPLDWATSTFNVTEFYENSSAWAYADVVIITVYSVIVTLDNDGFVTSDYRFEGFLVWQTDRYYDHQSSFTLIDILDAFQLFANQQLENWNWLTDTFNDIQFDLFDALNEMIRNDDFILDWLKTINVNINKGFDSVVSAITNISFPVSGGFSLEDLSDELQSLFIPTKTWADLGYDEYKDSLGVLALPFEFTFDSLDIIKDSSNYSSNFELHVNPLSVDIPDIDGSTKNFDVFVESDISMSPTSVFPASVWNTLQYFNLFTLVVVQALITYNHIFGGEER